jgi:DNA-binding NarL/FixJ family response regulator
LASSFRILIVDDSEPWRRVVRWMLKDSPDWQIVGEASDGVDGIRKTIELQPDLILLDVGLPRLNGIEAAKTLLSVAPQSRIVFVSIELCPEIVQGAMRTGAQGFVVKSDAASDLATAMRTVMSGRRFVGNRFANYDILSPDDLHDD